MATLMMAVTSPALIAGCLVSCARSVEWSHRRHKLTRQFGFSFNSSLLIAMRSLAGRIFAVAGWIVNLRIRALEQNGNTNTHIMIFNPSPSSPLQSIRHGCE